MMLVREGSALGESPYYVGVGDDAHASSLRELLGLLDHSKRDARALDPIGLRQYFDRQPDGQRTCFKNAQRLPAGFDLCREREALQVHPRKRIAGGGSLLDLLECVVTDLLARACNPVVALSGGLDSALLLALVRRLAGDAIPVVTLATRFPGYCELEQTLETARALGVNTVEVTTVDAADFVDALPEAIAACETPLFNLHPISKLLLARAVAHRGHDAMLTGDGADQVFAGADARNYVPIVGALMRAAGVKLLSPFLDERVAGWAACQATDSEKTALRRVASAVIPSELAWRRKCPRLAPEFDLSVQRDARLESRLSPMLQLPPPDARPSAEQTLWATTAILVRQLGGTC